MEINSVYFLLNPVKVKLASILDVQLGAQYCNAGADLRAYTFYFS